MRNLFWGTAFGITFLTSTGAWAQSECDSYVISAGDTIRSISFIAYGEEELYESLYEANRALLEANAPALAAGTEIYVPCYDELDFGVLGSGIGKLAVASVQTAPLIGPELPAQTQPAAVAEPVAIATVEPQPEAAAEPVALEPTGAIAALAQTEVTTAPIRFITGSDFKPFTDVSLENGGLFTELVATAVSRNENAPEFAIDFEDNWTTHLDELLPNGQYDVSFPWYRPNCEMADKLSAEMQQRCADFAWSDPYYQTVVAMYTRLGDPLVTVFSPFDLYGATVCRPAKYLTYDLDVVDLVEPNITLLRPETAGECFEMLLSGDTDVVTLNAVVAEDTIQSMRVNAVVVEMEEMATVQTLHAIASNTNPDALEYLDIVNQGIAQMSNSGEWISIVNRHLEN